MNIKYGFLNIYYIIVAFALTNSAILAYIANTTQNDLALLINRYTLYAIVILSLPIILQSRNALKKLFLTVFLFLGLALFQILFFEHSQITYYLENFIVHGLGGLLVGFAITNYKKLLVIAGSLSMCFGVLFITEPINRNLLKLNEMSTGYSLIPLVIFMLALYFTANTSIKNILLIVAIPLGITTFFFTSRGCGLSIVLAAIIFYVAKNKSQEKNINTRLIVLSGLLLATFWVLTIAIGSGIVQVNQASEGALIYKIFKNTVTDSNGRAEIWSMGLDIIKAHPLTGVGFGGDHIIASFHFTRYSSIHSVFLEILINFGIPLGSVILYVYLKRFFNCIKKSTNHYAVILVVAITTSFLVKLFVSSTYLDNMFPIMLTYGICINLKKVTPTKQMLPISEK